MESSPKEPRKRLLAAIVELAEGLYHKAGERALFEAYITRLDKVLAKQDLTGLGSIWRKEWQIFFQLPNSTPELVLPGPSNTVGSVTGYCFSTGGWGTRAVGDCPSCDGHKFLFEWLEGEEAQNICKCGYKERFICKL
jgi:hypothetical protein